MKDNQILLEHYSGYHTNSSESRVIDENSQFNVASARKSYLGLAVAYAIYEGKIFSLDDRVSVYIDEVDCELLGNTTLRHLVTHTHGLNQDENGKIFREFEPGEGWSYRGINVEWMTLVIQKLYNKPFTLLLKERVFNPMNLSKTAWKTEGHEELVKVIIDPKKPGVPVLGSTYNGMESNLFVSTREFAYWGNLHLNNGLIEGVQIVPKEVIELTSQIHSPILKDESLPENGLFWYVQGDSKSRSEIGERVPKGSQQIIGVTGPTLLIIPQYNVVVAKMYNKRYNYGQGNYLFYLREFSNLVADIFDKKFTEDML